MVKARIMLIEQEAEIVDDLRRRLQSLGYGVSSVASSGAQALQQIKTNPPDLALLDLKIGGDLKSESVADQFYTKFEIPVIYVASQQDMARTTLVNAFGPYGFISKPIQERELNSALEIGLFKRSMDRAYRQRQQWITAALQNQTDALIVTDNDGLIKFVNASSLKMTEWMEEEILGRDIKSVLEAQTSMDGTLDLQAPRTQAEQARQELTAKEWMLLNKQGKRIAIDVTETPLMRGGGEKRIGTMFILRGRAGEELAVSQVLKLSRAVEQIPDSVIITDKRGVIEYVNPAFEKITGYTKAEALGKTTGILKSGKHDDQFYREMWTKVLTGHVFRGVLTNKKKNNTYYFSEQTITPVLNRDGTIANIIVTGRDLTEQRVLEAQLTQAQKMESVGTLVGGISHDFNNIMNNILGFTHQLQKYLYDQRRVIRYREAIEKSALRGAELAKQLLSFVRQKQREVAPANLSTIIDEVVNLAQETFPRNIHILKALEENLLPINGNRGELYQAILNVCLNARDAMPSGGVLTIEAKNSLTPTHDSDLFGDAEERRVVHLSISDTGVGIPKELLEKIFDPFMTTKDRDRGTGLGLSVVYNIVRNHFGIVSVESEVGKGSTFTFRFPALRSRVEDSSPPVEREQSLAGTEVVLLVDDEDQMRELGKELLEEKGYHVLLASNGEEAVEVFREQRERIALVIIDLLMPKLDGIQAYLKLKEMNPELRVFFCTGYASDHAITSLLRSEGIHALQKPFRPVEFVRMVRSVLDESPIQE